MPTSGYSRGENAASSAAKETRKSAQNAPTTTIGPGLASSSQYLERFAQKFPRKDGSAEILPDFSSNFVENVGHPSARPLTTIATQSFIRTTSTTSTTTTTTTITTTTTTSTTTTTTTTTTLRPTVSTPSLLEKLKTILEKAAYVSKKFNIAASKRQKENEKNKQKRIKENEIEPKLKISTEPIIWGKPKADEEDAFEERRGESFVGNERDEEWTRFQSDRVLHPENYVNFADYDLPQKTHHRIDMGVIRFSNATEDESFGPSPIDPQPYHLFQQNNLVQIEHQPSTDKILKAPSITTKPRVAPEVQGRVASIQPILSIANSVEPTSLKPEFKPTPRYALVRKRTKPPPTDKSAGLQIGNKTPNKHELRLGPLPTDSLKGSGGNIDQSQLTPTRKEPAEKIKPKLTSNPSLNNLSESSTSDTFRPNVKETVEDFQPTLRPSQLSTEDPFLALFR